ncbi:MAG: O-antigen ligase family protein [Paracoccaceae bacterium]
MSETAHPYAAVFAFGRLGRVDVRLEPMLAMLAIIGLVAVPAVGTIGAIVTLAACGVLCVLRPLEMLTKGLQHWYVLALPLFCILSFIWSREPALSLRFALQLFATALVAVAICRHLTARAFVQTLFGALLVAMLTSAVIGGGVRADTGAWTGIYGSKNAFAGAASTFAILALGVMMSREVRLAVRCLGIVGCVIGAVAVLLAQSVSAILFLAPTALILVTAMQLSRLRALPVWAAFAFAVLAAILAALIVQAHWQAISAFVLDATGKDLTLTGRTELWAVALTLISERPILGVGYQAFWVQGHGDAEALWHMFGIESRGGFNFHNMYLSNAVEIGILGATMQAGLLFFATIASAVWAIKSASALSATLFALTFSVVLGSFIEVPVFFQFSMRTLIVFAAVIYAREALHNRHAVTDFRTL